MSIKPPEAAALAAICAGQAGAVSKTSPIRIKAST